MIVVGVEADLVDIESLGSVYVGDRNRDEFEPQVHTSQSKSRLDGDPVEFGHSEVGISWMKMRQQIAI